MFGTATFDRMPESFLTDPAVWDDFVGQVWQAVLSPLGLRADGTLIEIAPGSAPKIGHALARAGFHGTLHVVEASAPALEVLTAHYRRLLPRATLHLHASRLSACMDMLPQGADALLGNHIIDDMLLGASTQSQNTFDWATQYSDAVTPQTHAAFAQLQRHQESATAQVTTELPQAFAHLAPRHVVVGQYPSSTIEDAGPDALDACAIDVQNLLQEHLRSAYAVGDCSTALNTLPHYHNAHIGHNVLNPRYWLSCTKKN